jgi:putative membrane protein
MKFLKIDAILALLFFGGAQAFAPTSKSAVSLTKLHLESLEQKTPDYDTTAKLLQSYGEQARPYRRNVFSAADWVRSRRSTRFFDTILSTPKSALINQISTQVVFITFGALFVVLFNDILITGYTDLSRAHHDGIAPFLPALKLPLEPFTLSSGALGLLLTFRTNVSYSRWNEARTAWGKVINDSRSIARMGCIWSKSYKGIDDAAVQRLGEAICSFSRSLMNRTLPPQEDEENFKKYTYEKITDQSYGEVLRNAKHRPTAALAELTSTLVDFKLNPLHQVEVEIVVTGLCDALGASERIFTSPVPTFYTRHTARFLAFWLLALPLGLYEPLNGMNHLAVIPVMIALSGFLLGIEELATQMEEPFSILPMEKMCEGSIRTSVMEQVERSKMGVQAPYYGEGTASLTINDATTAKTIHENSFFVDDEANGSVSNGAYDMSPNGFNGYTNGFNGYTNGATIQTVPVSYTPSDTTTETSTVIEAKSEDTSLPLNWESAVDPVSGDSYYYNIVTLQSTWEKPSANRSNPADPLLSIL